MQCHLGVLVEGPARLERSDVRHGQRIVDRLDGADQIMVLRRLREGREFKPADGEEDAARTLAEGRRGIRHGGDLPPVVSRLALPGGTAEGEERNAALRRRPRAALREMIAANGCVASITQSVRFSASQACKPDDAAETADPHRERQRLWAAASGPQATASRRCRPVRQPFGQEQRHPPCRRE